METKFGIEEVYVKPLMEYINSEILKGLNRELGMKTFTLEEIEKKLSKAMKIESPLGQKIVAQFKDTPPDVEAKQILHEINRKRFESSGFVHGVKDELALELDKILHEQAMRTYDAEYGVAEDCELERDRFQTGYRLGMGAVALRRIV